MKLAAGLVLALLAAGALNVGFFVQHGATNTMPPLRLRHPWRSIRLLLANRQWVIGYATGWVGWGIYIAALSLAPLSLVQAVTAGGVAVLALLVHQLGTPLQRRERLGAAMGVGGLILLGASLAVRAPDVSRAHSSTVLYLVLAGSAVAGLLALVAVRGIRPAASLGCAAGLLFGVGDVATKAAVDGNGLVFIPVLAICTALGFIALQLAFQRGRVLETAGVSTLVNNIVPIVAGLAAFHEPIPSCLAGVARVASFAAVVVGAVLLAHAPPDVVAAAADPEPSDAPEATSTSVH
jgi:hypothetical protein